MRRTISSAVVIAIVPGMSMLLPRPALGFGDVLNKAVGSKTISFDWDDGNGKLGHMFFKGDLMRIERADSTVMVWNRATGQTLTLEAKAKRATSMTLARQPLDFDRWLRDFKNGKEENLGQRDWEGQKTTVFRVTRPSPSNEGSFGPSVLTFWVNPATELPVRIDVKLDDRNRVDTLRNLRFDIPLDDAIFAASIPADYKTEDLGGVSSGQLKRVPSTQEAEVTLTLKPRVGIGSLKFGDSKDKVIGLLGEPEEVRQGIDYRYPSKGISVMVHPSAGLLRIVATSKKLAGPFASQDFSGRTDKGIAIGASRVQIESLYGEPTTVTPRPGLVELEYKGIKTTFTLVQDHLEGVVMSHVR